MAGPINNAENQVGDAVVNRLIKLERDFYDYKTTPQKIGNGSINYAYFAPATIGPVAIAAGATATATFVFMDDTISLNYNGLPAINRISLLDPLISVMVDTYDAAHGYPYGASLTAAQKNVRVSWWCDYNNSNVSETDGQRYVIIQLTNTDSASHNYYIAGTAILPRPALKPQ